MISALTKGLALLIKALPVFKSAGEQVQSFIKPQNKYSTPRVVFITVMFCLLTAFVVGLGENDLHMALTALERFCDIVDCN